MNLITPLVVAAATAIGAGGQPGTDAKQHVTPQIKIDPARVAEIRLIERNRELVRKGLRRAPGAVYRADRDTVCRVYITHRKCWRKLSRAEKHRLAVERARHARYLARKRAVAQRDAMIRSGKLVHVADGGPIVPIPGAPGESAARSVLGNIAIIVAKTGAHVTDCYGQGHASPGHTVYGNACDFGGSDAAMDRVAQLTVPQGFTVLYDGRFGTHAAAGHGPSYVAGGNAHIHVEFSRRW